MVVAFLLQIQILWVVSRIDWKDDAKRVMIGRTLEIVMTDFNFVN